MTQHPADTVRAVVDVLVDEFGEAIDRASDPVAAVTAIAADILDATDLAAWRDRAQRAEAALNLRHNLDRLGDVVDLVAAVLERRMMLWDDARDTATEIACALLGDPVATRHDDGTVSLFWPIDTARTALMSRDLLELLVVDANRVRAGSEPYPTEPVELTAGQWWGMLLDLDPDARARAIDQVREAARAGGACWMLRHDERIATDAARLAQLEPEVDTMRRTLEALRGPLAPLVDRTPTPPRCRCTLTRPRTLEEPDEWEQADDCPVHPITAVLPLPDGRCTGRVDCTAVTHVRGCYHDPAATPTQESTR